MRFSVRPRRLRGPGAGMNQIGHGCRSIHACGVAACGPVSVERSFLMAVFCMGWWENVAHRHECCADIGEVARSFGAILRSGPVSVEVGEELSLDMGIPISNLVQVIRGRGDTMVQGTWVHPRWRLTWGSGSHGPSSPRGSAGGCLTGSRASQIPMVSGHRAAGSTSNGPSWVLNQAFGSNATLGAKPPISCPVGGFPGAAFFPLLVEELVAGLHPSLLDEHDVYPDVPGDLQALPSSPPAGAPSPGLFSPPAPASRGPPARAGS